MGEKSVDSADLPTFSILIETSNLGQTEMDALRTSLKTLAHQTISPERAEEVVLIEGPEVPEGAATPLYREYPWLTSHRLEEEIGYGDVKARGGGIGTGEVVVLCDADCRYQPDWLEQLLAPLVERPDVEIVAGETTTPVDGPYGLAMALAFVFPRGSQDGDLVPARWYWANNVAFRRSTLEAVPLPEGLPLFRGQTIVHGALLQESGHTIWRQPAARAIHELPHPSELLRRFFLKGKDAGTISRLMSDPSGRSFVGGMEPGRPRGRLGDLFRRLRTVLAEDRRRVLQLPIAIFPAAAAGAAYLTGRLWARFERDPIPRPTSGDAGRRAPVARQRA